MKYRIVESVEKKENINHPVDDNFTLSEELLNIKSEKINESAESDRDKDSNYNCCGINIDLEEFKDAIEQCYKCLCNNDDTVSDGAYGDFTTSELCKGFDECMENDLAIKELAQKFTEYSGISLSSDREKASFIYEVDELYGPDIWDAIDNCNVNESLEEDYEYSDYDKKLLVNRAKSIAKAISDLYNSNQVEAQGELPSVNEIAKALLDSPKKIDMYAKFLSKMKATKKAESLIEKLVKELMNFKKKLSMVKKPQPATESMNESVDELSEEEKKEIIDTLEDMIESGETSCECWDEPTKFLVKSELRKKGLKFNVSGNDRGNKFSYHFEWWNPKTESMDESLLVEKKVPDEDRYENNLIRSIINKRSNRANAKLEPAEQAVADKYGIKTGRYHSGVKTRVGRRNIHYAPSGEGYDDINFVDMARKGPERYTKAYETGIDVVDRRFGLSGSREGKKNDPYTKNALVQSRDRLNNEMKQDYNEVSDKAYTKKYYKNVLDNVDNEFDKKRDDYIAKINALTRELADVEKNREEKRTYNKNVINNITNDQKEIINKHRKNKQESFKSVPNRSINESEVSDNKTK